MKYLERFARSRRFSGPLAWWSYAFRRDASPLLDHLGAVIDHVKAFSTGGNHEKTNFVTACNKCNMRKSAEVADEFRKKHPRKAIKAKYGEPQHWDGFSVLFILMIADDRASVTQSELGWYKALTEELEPQRS
jgi:5-methylcytosine-specific restriction endonuclease McrA